MKKIYYSISITALMVLVAATGFSQGTGDHLTMSLDSCIQIDPSTIQFDLMIVSDGANGSDLRLNSCQWGINFNTACYQVGTLVYVAGTSDFIPPLNGFTVLPNPSEIRLVESAYSGANTGMTMVVGHKYRVARFGISSATTLMCNCNPNFSLQPDTGSIAGKTPTIAIAWIGSAASPTTFLSPGTTTGKVALQVNCALTLNPNNLTLTTTSTPASNGTATAMPDSGTGYPPFQYLWSDGQTGQTATHLCAGTYTVMVVDDAGCSATAIVTVTQAAGTSPAITLTGGDTLICTPSFVAYQWYCNGFAISGATDSFYVAANGCIYSVAVIDSGGCQIFTNILIFGIDPLNGLSGGMSVFPNPTNSSVTISYELPKPSDVIMALYNCVGQQIKMLVNERQSTGKHEIYSDLKKMPSGIYFIKATVDENTSLMKMVKMD